MRGASTSSSTKFLVGLSVDGPRELHDRYRVDKGGKGTFDQVMRGWETAEEAWSGVRTSCARCMQATRSTR